MNTSAFEKVLGRLLVVGVPAVALFLIDGSVTDPVNAPKFFLLGALSVSAMLVTLGNFKFFYSGSLKVLYVLLSIFTLISTLVLLVSNAPKTQSLYGVYGRNNGFLTYLFLVFVMLSASMIRSESIFRGLAWGVVAVGIVNVAYCGWVLLFGDFMSWSNPYGNILGTFGNPNFIGAFLGIFSTVMFAFLLGNLRNRKILFLFFLLIPVTLIEIVLSHAIQGRVLFVGGLSIVMFYYIRSKTSSKTILSVYSLAVVGVGILAIAGSLQRGPLEQLIYKTSVSLRGQYWLAGWNTGTTNPFFGVGFDSFGDWYKRSRDVRALVLPGPDTTTNAAHNVPLDLFAFGGWPLLMSYLAITIYIGILIVKYSFKSRKYDPVFVALSAAWICYQVQSIISINQIGLAVWGWTLSGALVGYVQHLDIEKDSSIKNSKVIVRKASVLSPGILAWIGFLIGAIISVPPLNADSMWMRAQKARSVELLQKSLEPSYLNPQNSFKYLSSIRAFEESGLFELSHKYSIIATEFNPDSSDAWQALYIVKNATPIERKLAAENLRRLDPLNSKATE